MNAHPAAILLSMSKSYERRRKKIKHIQQTSSVRRQVEPEIRKRLDAVFRVLRLEKFDPNRVRPEIIHPIILSIKAIDHSRIAFHLLPFNRLEAAILLRAAYEATVIAQYLKRYPEKIEDYHLYGDKCTLRNQLELLQHSSEQSVRAEQEGMIEAVKTRILKYYIDRNQSPPEELNSLDKLRKLTEKPQFTSFWNMREALKGELEQEGAATEKLAFQTYNVASQIAHSGRDALSSHYLYKSEHPLASNHALYMQIIYLTGVNARLLGERGIYRRSEVSGMLREVAKMMINNAPHSLPEDQL